MIEKKSLPLSLWKLLILSLSSFLLFMGIERFRLLENREYRDLKREAALNTKRAFEEIRTAKIGKGIAIENQDINATGLIGPEFSPLVTTLGLLSAKRTSTHPGFAERLVEMYLKAGVRRGDIAAIGLSGSFPGLNIACLVAARTLRLKPIVISSVGSSTWGATHPEMTWLDMEGALYEKGLIDVRSIAASLTGGTCHDFLVPAGVDLARAAIRRNHIPLIEERDLSSHIRKRMALYETGSKGKSIKIFVSVGGPLVHLGRGESRRQIPSGLLLNPIRFERADKGGIISIMLRRGIPVIHLLNINGLAKRHGLPVDSIPLPIPH